MYKFFNEVLDALAKSEEAINMLTISELQDFLEWCADGCEMCSRNDTRDTNIEYKKYYKGWEICYNILWYGRGKIG